MSTDDALYPWRPFRFDVTAAPREPQWLVDGLMARGMITMLSGDTSAGKSFVALALAIAVLDGGREWLGRSVAGPGRVLIIENEMPAYDVEARLRGFGIQNEHWDRLAYFDKSQAVALDDDEQAAQLAAVVGAFGPDLVILDTLFSLIPSIDHNSNGAAAMCYRDVLRPLARDSSLLMLHHENKPGEHGRGRGEYAATGARAWAHQADRHLTLAATGDKQVKSEPLTNGHTRGTYALELDSGKTRGALKPRLNLEIVTEANEAGRVISTDLRVIGERQSRESRWAASQDGITEQVLEFLRGCQQAKRAEIAAALKIATNDGRLGRALSALTERGLIVKIGHGTYQIAK